MHDQFTKKDFLFQPHRLSKKVNIWLEYSQEFRFRMNRIPKLAMLLFEREQIRKPPSARLAAERKSSKNQADDNTDRLNEIEPVGFKPTKKKSHSATLSRLAS